MTIEILKDRVKITCGGNIDIVSMKDPDGIKTWVLIENRSTKSKPCSDSVRRPGEEIEDIYSMPGILIEMEDPLSAQAFINQFEDAKKNMINNREQKENVVKQS